IFMNTLKYLQTHEYLLDVDLWRLFANLEELSQYFRGSLCQSHQTYCLNYSAAVFYLESLKQRHDFGIYLK
ncbi:hypothetical protein Celaphus_00011369, partial [Cervus elaphus hippelaphus]